MFTELTIAMSSFTAAYSSPNKIFCTTSLGSSPSTSKPCVKYVRIVGKNNSRTIVKLSKTRIG